MEGIRFFLLFIFGGMEQYSVSTLHSICFIGTREISILHVRFTAKNKLFINCIVMLCDPEIVTVLCNRYAGTVCL